MRFLTRRDGQNIDKDSYPAYEMHLDAIRNELPAELYEMLRFPTAAYQSGRTFYDAIVVDWRESLSINDWQHQTILSILAPRLDRLFEFSFARPGIKSGAEAMGSRVGALYAVEVSMPANASFAFCFLFMTRYEVELECNRFSFRSSETSRA
jgi:hypothetical protein